MDGVFDDDTRRAIRRYQASRADMDETGYLSEAVVVQLLARHGAADFPVRVRAGREGLFLAHLGQLFLHRRKLRADRVKFRSIRVV